MPIKVDNVRSVSWLDTYYVRKDILTVKGDIYVATATSTPIRLGVGSDDEIIIADSSESSGIKWGSISSLINLQIAFDADFRDFDMWVLSNCVLNANNQIILAPA